MWSRWPTLAEGETSPVEPGGAFEFEHPWGADQCVFAENLVREACGEEHVKDLDWDNSIVVDDR